MPTGTSAGDAATPSSHASHRSNPAGPDQPMDRNLMKSPPRGSTGPMTRRPPVQLTAKRSSLRPPFRCRADGPPAQITRDRNLLEALHRGGPLRPLIQLIRGKARVGQDATLLDGVARGAPGPMTASLPARFCIASEHPVFGSQMQRPKDRDPCGRPRLRSTAVPYDGRNCLST